MIETFYTFWHADLLDIKLTIDMDKKIDIKNICNFYLKTTPLSSLLAVALCT